MNKEKRYTVYFQGEEECFLNVKVENYENANLYLLFEGFLNEFENTDKSFTKYNTNNTQLYFMNEETNELVANLNIPIPENYFEYIIRPKIPVNYPAQRVDQNIADMIMDRAAMLTEKKDYFGALFLYHIIKEKGILEIAKIYYHLKDWTHLYKYIDNMKLQIHDPYINEILGYTYENTNNKLKAYETFSIFENTEATQKVACTRLYYQIHGMNKKIIKKSNRADPKDIKEETDKFNEIEGSNNFNNSAKKSNKKSRIDEILARKKTINQVVNEANTFMPRDTKIYAREMIDTLLRNGLTAKALKYFYTNYHYFDTILPLMCSSKRSATNMFVSFRSQEVNRFLLKKVCSALMKKDMAEQSLDLARFVFSRQVGDPEYAYILMHLYFVANMKEEMVNTFFMTFNCYQGIDRIGPFKVSDIRQILINNKDFSKRLLNHPLGEPLTGQWTHRPDAGPKNGLDFYRFFVLFFISLVMTKNNNQLMALVTKLALLFRTSAMERDELKSIYKTISRFRASNLSDKPSKDIYVFGDFQSFALFDVSNPIKKLNANFYPLIISGVSLWKLHSSKHNIIKKMFVYQLQKIVDENVIVLSFGKSDCKKYIPKFVMRNKFQSLTDACAHFASLYLKVAENVRQVAPKAKIVITAPISNKPDYRQIFCCFSTELDKILPKYFVLLSVFKDYSYNNETINTKLEPKHYELDMRTIITKYFKELIDDSILLPYNVTAF